MKSYIKPWEELKFTDDYMFCKIMRDKKICKEFVETILNIKIKKINYIIDQEELRISPESKYVKLDIRLEDIDKIINVELQNINHRGLVKRARYYQSVSDVESTQKGLDYNDLKDNYVIFICNFDPFATGSTYYEFENVCLKHNPALKLEDGTKKIFLNTTATDLSKLDLKLQSLYHYIKSEKVESDFTNSIAQKLSSIKLKIKERKYYMTYTLKLMDYKKKGFDEGLQVGRNEGIKFGIERGTREKTIEIAINLLKNNMTIDFIEKTTGLSSSEIEKLRENIEDYKV